MHNARCHVHIAVACSFSKQMSAATKAFLDLVTPLSAEKKAEYGRGAFYVKFLAQPDLEAFARAPSIQPSMLYLDEEKCQALCMPDAVLGAISAGRAPAIVILDAIHEKQRYYSDSYGAIRSEPCDFWFVRVETPPQPDELVSNSVSDWVERLVRSSAKPPIKDGTIFHVKMAENYDIHGPFVLEVVQPEDARMEIAQMEAIMDGQVASSSMRLLLDLSAKCGPRQVVIWLRATGETRGDVAWPITLSFTPDSQ